MSLANVCFRSLAGQPDENEHLLAKYDAAKGELDKTMAELNEMME